MITRIGLGLVGFSLLGFSLLGPTLLGCGGNHASTAAVATESIAQTTLQAAFHRPAQRVDVAGASSAFVFEVDLRTEHSPIVLERAEMWDSLQANIQSIMAPELCALIDYWSAAFADDVQDFRAAPVHQDVAHAPCEIPANTEAAFMGWLDHRVVATSETTRTLNVRLSYRVGEQSQETTLYQDLSVQQPPTLGAPLRGGPWLVVNNFGANSGHRRTSVRTHAGVFYAQRFAADYMLLGGDGCYASSANPNNTQFVGYGQEVLAVSDATVSRVIEGIPENIGGPEARAVPINLNTITGNAVWLDLGGDRFAFYAHLQPGSIRVSEGQTVRRGDVLGLLGNSGNSTAPHLHFHVSDAPRALDAEGLSFGFESWQSGSTTPSSDLCAVVGSPSPASVSVPAELTSITFPN